MLRQELVSQQQRQSYVDHLLRCHLSLAHTPHPLPRTHARTRHPTTITQERRPGVDPQVTKLRHLADDLKWKVLLGAADGLMAVATPLARALGYTRGADRNSKLYKNVRFVIMWTILRACVRACLIVLVLVLVRACLIVRLHA